MTGSYQASCDFADYDSVDDILSCHNGTGTISLRHHIAVRTT